MLSNSSEVASCDRLCYLCWMRYYGEAFDTHEDTTPYPRAYSISSTGVPAAEILNHLTEGYRGRKHLTHLVVQKDGCLLAVYTPSGI